MSAPGELIADRYRLVRLVGSGGMGAVWEARDERLARPVALKQLHAQAGVPPDEVGLAEQRAMREARITARLHHPHAVPVFDVVEHEGRPCLVMQYLPSTPLSELLRRDGPLDPARVAVIGAQTSAALAAAHAVGIVHRDVKPGNILITEDGSAVLSDFGISHALGDATLTSTGLVHGTPAFLAPEVARGAESGFASDVYSLGATLYTAVEGTPPFGTDPNAMALLHRIASGEPRPVERAGVLAPLIGAMLTAAPEYRPSMTEVARRLQLAADTGLTTGTATMPLAAADQPTRTAAPDDATPARATVAPVPAPAPIPAPVTAPAPIADPVPAPTLLADPGGGSGAGSGGSVVRSVSAPAPRRSERPGWLIPVIALVAVVALLIGVGWFLTRNSGAPTAAGPTGAGGSSPGSSTASSTARKSGSASPSGRPSSSSSSTSTASSSSNSSASGSSSAPASSAGQLAAAITDYYALMPDDTDAGWNRLTTRYQQRTASGRSGYDRFWGQISSVSVQDAVGDPPDTATATIVYTYRDGRVVTDRTEFGLVSDGGTLEIDSSKVLTSKSSGGTSGTGSSTGTGGPGSSGPGTSGPGSSGPGSSGPGNSGKGNGNGNGNNGKGNG